MFRLLTAEELEECLNKALLEGSKEYMQQLLSDIVAITEITDRSKVVLGGTFKFKPKNNSVDNSYKCLLVIAKTENFDRVLKDSFESYFEKKKHPVKIKVHGV